MNIFQWLALFLISGFFFNKAISVYHLYKRNSSIIEFQGVNVYIVIDWVLQIQIFLLWLQFHILIIMICAL